MTAQHSISLPLWFLLALAMIYGAAFFIVGIIPTSPDPELLATGLAIDLVILVPLLFWMLFIRTKRVSAVFLLPVFLLSFGAASLLLSEEHLFFLKIVGFVVPVAEVGVLFYVGYRVSRMIRAGHRAVSAVDDFYLGVRDQLKTVLDKPGIVGIFAYEISTFYYAFSRTRRVASDSGRDFHYHTASSAGAIFLAILLAVLAESIGLHFLLMLWSKTAALVHLVLSLYAVIFFLGDYRAIRRRPHIISPDGISLRCGIRWDVKILPENLRSISKGGECSSDGDCLNIAPFGQPTHIIELHDPVAVTGPYGITRTTRTIGIIVDERDAFTRAVMNLCSLNAENHS